MKLEELQMGKGTYSGVRFSPNTIKALKKYMKDNNIPNALRSDKMHTTILYSRKYRPDYVPAGEVSMKATAQSFDVFMTRPTKGEPTRCLVLKLFSPDLTTRHLELMGQHQATYDFAVYTPHVSLSYDIGDLDISTLPPFEGELEIVEEYGEDLDLDWATNKGTKDND